MWHIPLEINLSGDGLQILLMDQSLFIPWGGGEGEWGVGEFWLCRDKF